MGYLNQAKVGDESTVTNHAFRDIVTLVVCESVLNLIFFDNNANTADDIG